MNEQRGMLALGGSVADEVTLVLWTAPKSRLFLTHHETRKATHSIRSQVRFRGSFRRARRNSGIGQHQTHGARQ